MIYEVGLVFFMLGFVVLLSFYSFRICTVFMFFMFYGP